MARLNFRQGIVTHPTNTVTGEQLFLTRAGNNVNLNIVNQDLVTITFIHGETDYLYTESESIPSAWVGVPTNQNSWLYWEINLSTGAVERKISLLEPIESPIRPPNSAEGQLWYNTLQRRWQEFNGSTYREVVVVFAARSDVGTTFSSLSIDAPLFTGTQVGVSKSTRAGSLVFNSKGNAIKSGVGNQFFTTEDTFLTGVPTGASLRINNIVISGEAVCPIPAFSVVQYNDFNTICLANPSTLGEKLFGIVDTDAAQKETVTFTTEGLIFNEAWDWEAAGAKINDPLYIDATGQITLVNLFPNRPPVGSIVGRQVIYFAPRLYPQLNIESATTGPDGISQSLLNQINDNSSTSQTNEQNIATIGQTASNNTSRIQDLEGDASTLETAIDNRVLKTGDELTGKLLTPTTVATDEPETLTTKGYVDDLVDNVVPDLTQVESDITTLQTDVTSLQDNPTDLTQVESDITALQTDVTSLQDNPTDLTQVEFDIGLLRNELTDLQDNPTDLTQVESDITALQTDVTSLQDNPTDLTQVESDITALQTDVTSLQDNPTDLTQVESDITALQTTTEDIEADIVDAETDIENLGAAFGGIQQAVAGIDSFTTESISALNTSSDRTRELTYPRTISSSLQDLLLIDVDTLMDGQTAFVNTYVNGRMRGGGEFVWAASMPKSRHDGGIYISPTIPYDGSLTGRDDFLDVANDTDPTGNGVWIRQFNVQLAVEVEWYGAVGEYLIDDWKQIQTALDKVFDFFRETQAIQIPQTENNRVWLARSYWSTQQILIPTNMKLAGNAVAPYPVQEDSFTNDLNFVSGTTIYAMLPFTGDSLVRAGADNTRLEGVILDGDLLPFGTWHSDVTITSPDGVANHETPKIAVFGDTGDYRQDGNVRIVTTGVPGIFFGEDEYRHRMEAVAGDVSAGPYTWAVTNGTLPDGITMDVDGLISGIPTPGTATTEFVEFTVTDSAQNTQSATFEVRSVNTYLATDRLFGGTEGVAYRPLDLKVHSQDSTPFFHLLYAPQGLICNRLTGQITGTPELGTTGDYNVIIAISDNDEDYAKANIIYEVEMDLTIYQLNTTPRIDNVSGSGSGWRSGEFREYQFNVVAGDGAFTWSINNTRPEIGGFENGQAGFPTVSSPGPGVTLSSDGLLSGIPTATGNYHFFVRAESIAFPATFFWEELVVMSVSEAGLSIKIQEGYMLPAAYVGVPYSYIPKVSAPGGTFAADRLPTGLTIDSVTGEISGTPTGAPNTSGFNGAWSSNGDFVMVRNFRSGSGMRFSGPSNLHRYKNFIIRNCYRGLDIPTQCFDSHFEDFYVAHCYVSMNLGSGATSNTFTNGRLEFCWETQLFTQFASYNMFDTIYFDTSGHEGFFSQNCRGWNMVNCIFFRSGKDVWAPGPPLQPNASGRSTHVRLENNESFTFVGNNTLKGSNQEGYDGVDGIPSPDWLRSQHCITLFDCRMGTITGNTLTGCAGRSIIDNGGDHFALTIENNAVNAKDYRSTDVVNVPALNDNIVINGDFQDFQRGGEESSHNGDAFVYDPQNLAQLHSRNFGTVWSVSLPSDDIVSNSAFVERRSLEQDKTNMIDSGVNTPGISPPFFYYVNMKKDAETNPSVLFQDFSLFNGHILQGENTDQMLHWLSGRSMILTFYGKSVNNNIVLPRLQYYADSGDNNFNVIDDFKSLINLSPRWERHSVVFDFPDLRSIRLGDNPNFEFRIIMDNAQTDYDVDLAGFMIHTLAPSFIGNPYTPAVETRARESLTRITPLFNGDVGELFSDHPDSIWTTTNTPNVQPNSTIFVRIVTTAPATVGVRSVDEFNAVESPVDGTLVLPVKVSSNRQIQLFSSDHSVTTFFIQSEMTQYR